MAQTVVEKIAQAHLAEGPKRPLRAGDFVSLRPRHVMTHDNSSAVMKKFQAIGAKKIHDSRQPVFALDHDIQNQEDANLAKYRAIEAFARQHSIDFYPAGSGIGQVDSRSHNAGSLRQRRHRLDQRQSAARVTKLARKALRST